MVAAAVAAGPLQFTNLRHFKSKIHTKLTLGRTPQRANTLPRSSAGLEILRTAEEVQLPTPTVPVVDLESVPPFEEWHRHPELLAGYAHKLLTLYYTIAPRQYT